MDGRILESHDGVIFVTQGYMGARPGPKGMSQMRTSARLNRGVRNFIFVTYDELDAEWVEKRSSYLDESKPMYYYERRSI